MGIIAEACDDVAVMYMGRIVEFGTIAQIFNNPQHPYTKGLLQSVPVPGMPEDMRLASIPGNTPDAQVTFDRCAFEERCTEKCTFCRQGHPPTFEWERGHTVACYLKQKGHKYE